MVERHFCDICDKKMSKGKNNVQLNLDDNTHIGCDICKPCLQKYNIYYIHNTLKTAKKIKKNILTIIFRIPIGGDSIEENLTN